MYGLVHARYLNSTEGKPLMTMRDLPAFSRPCHRLRQVFERRVRSLSPGSLRQLRGPTCRDERSTEAEPSQSVLPEVRRCLHTGQYYVSRTGRRLLWHLAGKWVFVGLS